jgi:hypothetical protein
MASSIFVQVVDSQVRKQHVFELFPGYVKHYSGNIIYRQLTVYVSSEMLFPCFWSLGLLLREREGGLGGGNTNS